MKNFYNIDRLPIDTIKKIQGELLFETVFHACEKSPYYNKLFINSGLSLTAFKDNPDINRLPFTSRLDIQKEN